MTQHFHRLTAHFIENAFIKCLGADRDEHRKSGASQEPNRQGNDEVLIAERTNHATRPGLARFAARLLFSRTSASIAALIMIC